MVIFNRDPAHLILCGSFAECEKISIALILGLIDAVCIEKIQGSRGFKGKLCHFLVAGFDSLDKCLFVTVFNAFPAIVPAFRVEHILLGNRITVLVHIHHVFVGDQVPVFIVIVSVIIDWIAQGVNLSF